MIAKQRTIFLMALFFFVSCSVFSMEKAVATPIKMGPVLRFSGQDGRHHTWKVSALYLVAEGFLKHHEEPFYFHTDTFHVENGTILGRRFGYEFIRFDMEIPQTDREIQVSYHLHGENNDNSFVVPAIGQTANILYHSCNGFQRQEDKRALGGIQHMWEIINHLHEASPFHLQLPGGDQLYTDGPEDDDTPHFHARRVGDIYGVFALPSLRAWLDTMKDKDHHRLTTMAFDETMLAEVSEFYFNHYVKHYNEKAFTDVLRKVPGLPLPDDHDFFDGFGSYPDYLQNSAIMQGIRAVGLWYAFVIQHQLAEREFPPAHEGQQEGFHFLHAIDDGKLAILGVDTRSERTTDQVVSKTSWEHIFAQLEKLPRNCRHLIVILGIPVVYPSTKMLEKLFSFSNHHPHMSKALHLMPGLKKNIFNLLEAEDDIHDGWGHKSHYEERNMMITALQAFARRFGIRTTLLGGDVHLGSAGLVYNCERGTSDRSSDAICQITSSPVGNMPPAKLAAIAIAHKGKKPQRISDTTAMRMIKIRRVGASRKKHSIIYRRNFVVLKSGDQTMLDVRWFAERNPHGKHAREAPKVYELSIPAIHE